jgi:hypothetical protein
MLKIKEADNGWIVETIESNDSVREYVFQFDDCQGVGAKTDVEAFREVLWKINELLGPSTSRYSEQRIYIKIDKGDKLEQ